MEKGRRKKVIGGLVLVLASTFVLTQTTWAGTLVDFTDVTTIDKSFGTSTFDVNKNNGVLETSGATPATQMEPVTTTDEDRDIRTTTIITLFGRVIKNAFVVTRQLVHFITDDLVANTRTVGDQTTNFTVDELGRTLSATGNGSSTTVDSNGIVGDSEINEAAARVVTTSNTRSIFEVIFGNPVTKGVTQDSHSMDELNMRESYSRQKIAYDVDAVGRYLGGEGTIDGTGNNLNFVVKRTTNDDGTVTTTVTDKIVSGSEEFSQTKGVIHFVRAAGANQAVAAETETITMSYDVRGDLSVTAQDSHTDFDTWANMVRNPDGTISTSAHTYSVSGIDVGQIDTRKLSLADLTQRLGNEGSTDLLKGTAVLKEIAGVGVNDGTDQDGKVRAAFGILVDKYTVTVGSVTFGAVSRLGNPLATQQTQDSRTRDFSQDPDHPTLFKNEQTDSHTVFNIAYASNGSGRIVSQDGLGDSRVTQLNTTQQIPTDAPPDPATGNPGDPTLGTTLSNIAFEFTIDHVNNQALLTKQTATSGQRDYINNTQTLSTQVTTFDYATEGADAGKLLSATAVSRSSSTKLDGNTGNPLVGTHSESYSVTTFAIMGNTAQPLDSKSVTITDDRTNGANRQTYSYSLAHNEYVAGVSVGKLANAPATYLKQHTIDNGDPISNTPGNTTPIDTEAHANSSLQAKFTTDNPLFTGTFITPPALPSQDTFWHQP